MTEQSRSMPSLTGLIAGGLVVLGIVLWMFASKAFIIVAGLGAFGPGILRELNLLRDQDEFQRQSAARAGYHAYLIGGLLSVVFISLIAWKGIEEDAAEWISLVLVVLWLSWMFSTIMTFWGARTASSRILLAFGSFWALFVLATLFIGDDSVQSQTFIDGLLGVLFGTLVVAPFFVLAFTAHRWPRVTGGSLLVVATVIGILTMPKGNLAWSTELLTTTLLLVPLVAAGIALLRDAVSDDSSIDQDKGIEDGFARE